MDDWYAGMAPIRLTPDPLGDEGQMSDGPDHLNPAVPEQREELIERGYLGADPDPEIVGDEIGDDDSDPLFDPFGGREPLWPDD